LLRLIANLLDPTDGDVLVTGKPARQARLDRDYGMALQQSALYRGGAKRKRGVSPSARAPRGPPWQFHSAIADTGLLPGLSAARVVEVETISRKS
jgi:hypothetical protein